MISSIKDSHFSYNFPFCVFSIKIPIEFSMNSPCIYSTISRSVVIHLFHLLVHNCLLNRIFIFKMPIFVLSKLKKMCILNMRNKFVCYKSKSHQLWEIIFGIVLFWMHGAKKNSCVQNETIKIKYKIISENNNKKMSSRYDDFFCFLYFCIRSPFVFQFILSIYLH